MEIVVHSKKSLFQQMFQKKLYHFNRNSKFRSVMLKMIQLDMRSRTKNPTPTPYDSATLIETRKPFILETQQFHD